MFRAKAKGDKNDAQNEDESIALNQSNGDIDKDNDCGITIRIESNIV